MKHLRFLVLAILGFSLVLQGSALAQGPTSLQSVADCMKMDCVHGEDAAAADPDGNVPCNDMGLECLISMTSLSPVALPHSGSTEPVTVDARITVTIGLFAPLNSVETQPDSPPPQA